MLIDIGVIGVLQLLLLYTTEITVTTCWRQFCSFLRIRITIPVRVCARVCMCVYASVCAYVCVCACMGVCICAW